MPKALVTTILRDEVTGEEYRLVAGEEAPAMPADLGRAAMANGYIEDGPPPPRIVDPRTGGRPTKKAKEAN